MALPRIEVRSSRRCQLLEVTDGVRAAVREAGLLEGAVLVYCPHTTAGVTVQENADPDVAGDLLLALEDAVPRAAASGSYRHGEGNSDAHVKASLVGSSCLVPVAGGVLQLGTWQGIFLCEFDGPRLRHLALRFLGAP
jgi:secondary thiamine-phosphate synthase enzyme